MTLLDALDLAEAAGLSVHLDVLGEGDLQERCRAAATLPRRTTRVNLLGVMPYGPPFFARLREYHAVLVPSLSDEQPRIVYDAYSQAVPVIASGTPGLCDCVVAGETGMLFEPNSGASLLECLRVAVLDKPRLAAMGARGLERARRVTHRGMHRDRWALLDESLRRHAGRPVGAR